MQISNPTQLTSVEIAQTAVTEFFRAAAVSPELWRSHINGTGAVASLEVKLATHYGKRFAISFSSATTALLAIALALELKETSFITTPLSYGATLAGFLLLNNRPQFVNTLEPLTQTLCSEAVRRSISTHTKAIVAADIFGNPSNTIALRKVADEFGLWYIADAAQSFGGMRSGMPASCLADAIVVSLTVGKSLTAGEGGAVVTDDELMYQKLVWLSHHPDRQRLTLGFNFSNQFGINGRIHPLAAVIANATFESSLAELSVHQRERLKVVAALNEIGLTAPMPFEADGILPTFFSLIAQWQERAEPERLINALNERGIDMRIAELPCSWIPEQASFLAQYGHLWDESGASSNNDRVIPRQTEKTLFALQDLSA